MDFVNDLSRDIRSSGRPGFPYVIRRQKCHMEFYQNFQEKNWTDCEWKKQMKKDKINNIKRIKQRIIYILTKNKRKIFRGQVYVEPKGVQSMRRRSIAFAAAVLLAFCSACGTKAQPTPTPATPTPTPATPTPLPEESLHMAMWLSGVSVGYYAYRTFMNCDIDKAYQQVVKTDVESCYEGLLNGEYDIIFVPETDAYEGIEQYVVGHDAVIFLTWNQVGTLSLTSEEIYTMFYGGENRYLPELGKTLVPVCMWDYVFFDWFLSGASETFSDNVLTGASTENYARYTTPEILAELDLEEVRGIRSDWIFTMDGLQSKDKYVPLWPMEYAEANYSGFSLWGPVSIVDGVEATDESVLDGSYPFTYNICAVIRSDEPEDSMARRIAEFCISEEGQDYMGKNSFIMNLEGAHARS